MSWKKEAEGQWTDCRPDSEVWSLAGQFPHLKLE